jgi:hypothetical protein
VAHTKEQRDRQALCGAKKKNGDTCRAFAGQGTDHPGIGTCKFHLGNSQKHKTHAAKQEAMAKWAERTKFGEPLEVGPAEALLGVLHLSAGHLAWIRDELARIKDKRKHEAQVLMRLWDEERDRIARISKAALDVGVAEKQIQIAESYGQQLATLLRAIFFDSNLGLTDAQKALLPDILRLHLSHLETRPALALVEGGKTRQGGKTTRPK